MTAFRWGLYALALLTFVIVFLAVFSIASRTSLSPAATSSLPVCNTLSYGGKGAFNVLFFGSKAEAQSYSKALLTQEPFEPIRSSFNVYYIDTFDAASQCSLYKGVAVLCYTRALLKAAGACPHNTIIVLVDEPSTVRSSTYKGVVSLNRNHPLRAVMRHEFGHVLGLAEEYVPATLTTVQPNCKASCDQFSSETEGCFEGCSSTTYFRSVDKGVMRTLETVAYGKYDDALLQKEIATLVRSSITGNAIDNEASCDQQSYLLAQVDRSSEGEVVISGITRETGCPGTSLPGYYQFILNQGEPSEHILSVPSDALFTDAPRPDLSLEGETYQETRSWATLPDTGDGPHLTINDNQGNTLASTVLMPQGDILCSMP